MSCSFAVLSSILYYCLRNRTKETIKAYIKCHEVLLVSSIFKKCRVKCWIYLASFRTWNLSWSISYFIFIAFSIKESFLDEFNEEFSDACRLVDLKFFECILVQHWPICKTATQQCNHRVALDYLKKATMCVQPVGSWFGL